jgi:hypothetical protein
VDFDDFETGSVTEGVPIFSEDRHPVFIPLCRIPVVPLRFTTGYLLPRFRRSLTTTES